MKLVGFEALLIYIICIIFYPKDIFTISQLIYVVLGISILCFEMIGRKEIFFKMIGLGTLLIIFMNPYFSILGPAFSYYFFYKKSYIFPLSFFLTCWILIPDLELIQLFTVILLYGTSFYLAYQGKKREELECLVKNLRDSSKEQEIQLKDQYQRLLESQNDTLYVATLQERNRIAREIHDNVGHMLSRSILQVGALLSICKEEKIKEHLVNLKETLNEAMTNIRESVHDLHDEAIQFDDAIRHIIEEFTFCPVVLNYKISKQVPKKVKYCFLSIIKEGLNNIMKHSNATKVSIVLKEHVAFYQLIIEDNGEILKESKNLEESQGIGLKSMRERVFANHGMIHITTENGFRIFVTIPK